MKRLALLLVLAILLLSLFGCAAEDATTLPGATAFLPFDTRPPTGGAGNAQEQATPRPSLTVIPIWSPRGGFLEEGATLAPLYTTPPDDALSPDIVG